MKSLLVVRHAKSGWDNPGIADFDRPLNERGHKDAPMMARRLLERKVHIDRFVSSTALRALTTARYFHEAYKAAPDQLVLAPFLYHASQSAFYDIVAGLNNDWNRVAVFSHNPGITDFVNSLGVARVDNMPTCAVFGVHAEIEDWKDFEDAEKKFWLFDYPKNL